MYLFGPGFTDTISQGKKEYRHLPLSFLKPSHAGTGWMVVLIIGVLILTVKLIYLQVINGDKNRQLADEQRIRYVQIPASRGLIVDRNEQILVQNRPIFRKVVMNPQTGLKLELITRDQALNLETRGFAHNIVEGVGRSYLYGPFTAHLLGYVGEVNAEELEKHENQYQIGDLVGRVGIEKAFDQWLRGENGAQLVEVDTAGKLVRQVGVRSPTPGRRLQLSIDIKLQQIASQALNNKIGAVVISQANTGEILALVSSPTYNPELLDPANAQTSSDKIIGLFNNPQRPLVNRAIAAVYPPGSTFKIITGVAALENKVITPQYTYKDTGIIRVGDYEYTNWYLTQYGGKEGIIDLPRAIARSTDTFFYKIGELIGPQQLADWAVKFGLGKKTGIGLQEELPGLVPNPDWKIKTIGERWYLGNTYHMAIGQGDLLTTPLQVNLFTAVIANNGKLCKPKLILSQAKPDQDLIQQKQDQTPNTNCQDIGISEPTIQLIKQGMVDACSTGGTAFPFFNFKPQVACKTGTAEFGSADKYGNRKTHAWLTAFAPADEPEIVVTVLLEEGGEGSKNAGPVALEIIKKYFESTSSSS